MTVKRDLPLDRLDVDPLNPRRHVDPDDLADLAASIADVGILDELKVRPVADDRWGVLSGQRRMLAARRAGLDVVPCIVHDVDDRTALTIAASAHSGQRQLLPSEEGTVLHAMVAGGATQAAVAARVGCSQARVSNLIKLLDVDEDVRARVDAGEMGVARALETVRRRYDTTHPKPRGRAAQQAREAGPVAAAHLQKHTAAQLLGVTRTQLSDLIDRDVLEVDPVSGGIPLHAIRQALHGEVGTAATVPADGRPAGVGHEWRRVPTDAWKTFARYAHDNGGDTSGLLRAFAAGLTHQRRGRKAGAPAVRNLMPARAPRPVDAWESEP